MPDIDTWDDPNARLLDGVELRKADPVEPTFAPLIGVVRRPFIDPVKGAARELVVLIGVSAFDGLKVEHGCTDLADVSADLDAWFCPVCHAQGRISGAWALDVYDEVNPKSR